ncbi:hypothetical protein CC78DRAFT_316786 [Lojkania enalia]|uniref:Uncharacterized protein n=1 Tax=Lojkania enalia TaxID=147567 RepID=A0A9P4K7T1_9PLEO|nr:hypothetical protein CC78DRAFT_316786 [Didymosphaeria enalia]
MLCQINSILQRSSFAPSSLFESRSGRSRQSFVYSRSCRISSLLLRAFTSCAFQIRLYGAITRRGSLCPPQRKHRFHGLSTKSHETEQSPIAILPLQFQITIGRMDSRLTHSVVQPDVTQTSVSWRSFPLLLPICSSPHFGLLIALPTRSQQLILFFHPFASYFEPSLSATDKLSVPSGYSDSYSRL